MTDVRCTACGSAFSVPFDPEVVRRMPRCGLCDGGALEVAADGDVHDRAARVKEESGARRAEAAAVRAEARQARLAAARRREAESSPLNPS